MRSNTICDIQPNTTQRGVGVEGDCGVEVTSCPRHAYMQPVRQRRVLGFLTHHILTSFGNFQLHPCKSQHTTSADTHDTSQT